LNKYNMREINKISEALFEKIRDRFEDVSLGDENAKATQNPEDARFFNFDYTVDGVSHGNITISVIDETSLKIYFSKNISSELVEEEKAIWYGFLRELREFAKRNLLSFEPRDITRSTLKHRDLQQVSKSDSTYSKDEVIGESRMHGTSRSSYEQDGNVKIIVRHSDRVDPEQRGARSRKIKALFVETTDGERFKLPYNNLRYARAMARHVSEGGDVNDDFGQHITKVAEECSKLRPFKSQMVRRTFEDAETQAMVEAAFEYHGLLNDTLKRMSGRKGYAACKESFQMDEQTLMDDFDVDSMRERFVRKTYNDATDTALPIVQKAYNMKKSNKFAQQFESWATNVAEGTWATPEGEEQVSELIDLLMEPLIVGVDATNATSALYNLIGDDVLFDRLGDLAEENPEADARDVVMDWVQENMPEIYGKVMNEIGDVEPPDQYESAVAEGDDEMEFDRDLDEPDQEYGSDMEFDQDRDNPDQFNRGMSEGEYDQDQVESIQTAIIRRITSNIGQHQELLMKAGPDGVMNAARDVASFHAPMEELGSSDISIMVREVYNEVGVEYPEMNEAKDKVTYDPKTGKLTGWEHESDWKSTQGKDPRGKVTHLSDVARRKSEELAKTDLDEGKMKEVDMDLTELSDEEFQAKYNKSKEEMKAALAEGYEDHVNKDEKLKRMGAKELSTLDKLKIMPSQMKAFAKGDSEDDLLHYNKMKSTNEDAQFNEDMIQMRRIAGLIK
jgi:hypothetical protein